MPKPMLQMTRAGKTIHGVPANRPITSTDSAITRSEPARAARGNRSLRAPASRDDDAALP